MQVYQLDQIKRPVIEHDEFIGFKSPASNYLYPRLSLDEKCDLDNPAVFLMRVEVGDGPAEFKPGDIVIVDCSLTPQAHHLVVGHRDGEPSFVIAPLAAVKTDAAFHLFGVITYGLHHFILPPD